MFQLVQDVNLATLGSPLLSSSPETLYVFTIRALSINFLLGFFCKASPSIVCALSHNDE